MKCSISKLHEGEEGSTGRLDVAQKAKELQAVVDRVYPGYRVILTKDARQNKGQFGMLPQVEQISRVFHDVDGTIELRALHKELQNRGSQISLDALMSLLSKFRRRGKFKKFGRGLWGLPESIAFLPPENPA